MPYKGFTIESYWEGFIVSRIDGKGQLMFDSLHDAFEYIDKEAAK